MNVTAQVRYRGWFACQHSAFFSAKTGLSHAHFSITRSPAQEPAHKDLGRNDQARVITSKAAYAPVSNRAGSRSL
ncbi:Alpha-galactosidase [Lacticaseibacillus rhamnosus LRHMDP3]|uniref:Alpha-galactosidase n=1 Tax=Lacticaseibacillus rhamnosus LRHMDP3 TaxID=1203259 RepID=A0AB33XTB3_LACRH|nr:Alpha-galactosidase [Lacticaseibacillus rhamnosus LRHMDP3]